MAKYLHNDESKSQLTRIHPATTNDVAIGVVNKIIKDLKEKSLLNKNQLNIPDESTTLTKFYRENKIIREDIEINQELSLKIDRLKILIPPISVRELRIEINKVVDILKYGEKPVSSKDFEKLVERYERELNELNRIDYGVASSIYLEEDILEYGDARTVTIEKL